MWIPSINVFFIITIKKDSWCVSAIFNLDNQLHILHNLGENKDLVTFSQMFKNIEQKKEKHNFLRPEKKSWIDLHYLLRDVSGYFFQSYISITNWQCQKALSYVKGNFHDILRGESKLSRFIRIAEDE